MPEFLFLNGTIYWVRVTPWTTNLSTGDCTTSSSERQDGHRQTVTVDHGPEFTSLALDAWVHARGVRLAFTQPGKPTQNAYIESFNGRFRDECLNDQWFSTLYEARVLIEAWRQDYNSNRPHSSLGYVTPAEFAAQHQFATPDSTQLCC